MPPKKKKPNGESEREPNGKPKKASSRAKLSKALDSGSRSGAAQGRRTSSCIAKSPLGTIHGGAVPGLSERIPPSSRNGKPTLFYSQAMQAWRIEWWDETVRDWRSHLEPTEEKGLGYIKARWYGKNQATSASPPNV